MDYLNKPLLKSRGGEGGSQFCKISFKFIFVFLAFTFLVPQFPISLITPVNASTANWYDTSYKYRRAITVDNTSNASTLTNYQVQVTLSSSNFDFTKAQTSGQDIRVADSDGTTLLDYWIESYDSSAQAATIWVEVPSVSASLNHTIYIYYGNSGASNASTVTNTFLVGDDFEDFNAATEFGTPRFAMGTAKIGNDIYVSSFNFTTGEVFLHKSTNDGSTWSYISSPWAASTSRTHSYMATDNSSKIYVSVTNTAQTSIYLKKSIDSGTSWGSEVIVTSGLTVALDPEILYVSNDLLLVAVRVQDGSNYDVKIYQSIDDGDTWSLRSTAVNDESISIEDIEMIKLQNGDILLGYEKETTETGESGDYQKRSTDNGETWGTETTIYDSPTFDDEGGNYVQTTNGTIWYFFATNEDTGVSYDKNVVKKLVSTDNGVTWGSKTTIYDSYNNVEPVGEIDSGGNLQLLVTKHYNVSGHSPSFQMIQVQANGTQLSDKNWSQDDGLAYVISENGNKIMRIDGEERTLTRGYLSNSNFSGSDYIVETRIKPNNTAEDARIVTRYTDKNNNYLIMLRGGATNRIYVYKRVAGSHTLLNEAVQILDSNTWYDLKVVHSGTSIKTYVDGVLKNDFTDSTYASGKVGMASSNSADTFPSLLDNFRVRKFTSAEPTTSVGSENSQISSGVTLNNDPIGQSSGKTRITGNANTGNSSYSISEVNYSVNGGGWQGATATDGSFNSSSENFYLDFLPTDNNYSGDGYTIRVKAQSSSGVWQDNLFYFQPFNLDSQSNNSFTSNNLPTFEFSINKDRFSDLKDNLSKFQVLVNRDSNSWQTYIDDIPINYDNNNGNGTYENNNIWVNYSDNNSSIQVYSKAVDSLGNPSDKYFEDGGHKLSNGSYQWKVVAVDKAGHSQETETWKLRVGSKQFNQSLIWFPLTINYISGVGKVDLSTIHPQDIKNEYFTSYSAPTIKGIANAGTTITLTTQDTATNTYTATTGVDSRYAITLPINSLRRGRSYTTTLSVKDSGNNYNELPSFKLRIGSFTRELSQTEKVIASPSPTPKIEEKNHPTPAPNITQKQKRCFFFVCW